MNCSDQTAAEVDKEVVEILKKSYEKAKELLSENRDVMDKLAAFLIEKETITGKEFMEIYRREKGIPEPEETRKSEEDAAKDAEKEGSGEAAKQEEPVLPKEAVLPEEVREPEEVKAPGESEFPAETELPTEAGMQEGLGQPEEAPQENPSNVGVFTNRTLD